MTTHTLPAELLERPVRIHVAGCGGNGSQVLTGLARLDRALRACGHPGGLSVVAFDPDSVSEANIGRQLFAADDIGANKAAVLVTRLNAFYGLAWDAVDRPWEPDAVSLPFAGGYRTIEWPDILISCVDSAAARRGMHRQLTGECRRIRYWLDLGNEQHSGQVVLGELDTAWRRAEKLPHRLPTVTELFPELLDESRPEDDRPSCSLAEALERQSLFVNDHCARWALEILRKLLQEGRIAYHGAFINLRSGHVNPIPVPAPAEKKGRRR